MPPAREADMNCKKVQELILTDYIDNEASEKVRDLIKAHIASCEACRVFEQAVRQRAGGVFRDTGPVEPPAEIWHRIQDALREERLQETPSYLERMLNAARESFFFRRPAYAFATALTVLLVIAAFGGVPLRRQMLVRDYLNQKTSFMIAMNDPANGETDRVVEFETAIERYLF